MFFGIFFEVIIFIFKVINVEPCDSGTARFDSVFLNLILKAYFDTYTLLLGRVTKNFITFNRARGRKAINTSLVKRFK